MSLSSTGAGRGLEGNLNGMVLVQGEEGVVNSKDVSLLPSMFTSHVCMSGDAVFVR